MRKAEIIRLMDKHLRQQGFAEGTWSWVGTNLIVLVNGQIRNISIKAGLPKWRLVMVMGRIAGWADILGIGANARDQAPAYANGKAGDHQMPLFATA